MLKIFGRRRWAAVIASGVPFGPDAAAFVQTGAAGSLAGMAVGT